MPSSISVEAQALESDCCVERTCRTPEDLSFPSGGPHEPHKHGIGYKTKRDGSSYVSSPNIKHFFVSLFAVVHAAAHAPISWHRAPGEFIPTGATAERCIMVRCPLERSWYSGLWEKNKNQT